MRMRNGDARDCRRPARPQQDRTCTSR